MSTPSLSGGGMTHAWPYTVCWPICHNRPAAQNSMRFVLLSSKYWNGTQMHVLQFAHSHACMAPFFVLEAPPEMHRN